MLFESFLNKHIPSAYILPSNEINVLMVKVIPTNIVTITVWDKIREKFVDIKFYPK